MKKIILINILILFNLIVAGCGITGNVVSEENVVKIPLSNLSDKVQFYSSEDDGTEIKYFAVLGSDGKVRTAFDGCDICGWYKGYRQEGSDVVCNNCGKTFSIDSLGSKNTLNGGCWPSYLNHELKGNEVLIKTNDLVDEKKRFI